VSHPGKSPSQNGPSCCDNASENNVAESDEERTIVNGIKTQSSGIESLFDGSGDVSAAKCQKIELIPHFSSQDKLDRCI
jgi:hypothetical protein